MLLSDNADGSIVVIQPYSENGGMRYTPRRPLKVFSKHLAKMGKVKEALFGSFESKQSSRRWRKIVNWLTNGSERKISFTYQF